MGSSGRVFEPSLLAKASFAASANISCISATVWREAGQKPLTRSTCSTKIISVLSVAIMGTSSSQNRQKPVIVSSIRQPPCGQLIKGIISYLQP